MLLNKIAVTVASDMAENFNPRPRKEGDYLSRTAVLAIYISIHALAKRATVQALESRGIDIISIHALAKRATVILIIVHIIPPYFNPRPRKEGDVLRNRGLRL